MDEQQEKINNSHRYFAAFCFNACWDLIDKNQKTEEDTENMIHLAHSSFWHWTQVQGVTPTNISVGYWQLARVYALAGNGDDSLYYGKRCMDIGLTNNLDPFYIGYAYEAIARANQVLKRPEQTIENKAKAREYYDKILDDENKNLLQNDLNNL